MGWLAAVYPAVWGGAQLFTGAMSDLWGRKWMIAAGMAVQSIGIWLVATDGATTELWFGAMALLGIGTALVYPTLLAAIGDGTHASWRASAVGVYRFWRDLGYAIGALAAGALADRMGTPWAVRAVAGLTLVSGIVVAVRMREGE